MHLKKKLWCYPIYSRYSRRRVTLEEGTKLKEGRADVHRVEFIIESGCYKGYRFKLSYRERHMYIGGE